MKFSFLAIIGVAALTASTLRAQPPATTTTATATTTAGSGGTTNDGVFTDEQAKRGEGLYQSECASCHGPEMSGGEMAPPLTGAEFVANWNDLSVGDLFERIRVSMPANNPGSLSRQQNVDIVAYLLKFDKYPAGQTELPALTEALKGIKIVPLK